MKHLVLVSFTIFTLLHNYNVFCDLSSFDSGRTSSFIPTIPTKVKFPSDFKTSRLISVTTQEDNSLYNQTGAGGLHRSVFRDHVEDVLPQQSQQNNQELETGSTFTQGRFFQGGGGGGWGSNSYCQNLHSYNSGCCTLGYSNCCNGGGWNGGGGIHYPRPPINQGWGPVKGHVPHHQGYYRPPIRPIIPVIPLPRPIHHGHHGGWNQHQHEKPGTCSIKSSLSFLNKYNIFNKAKGLFTKGHDHGGGKGWGWDSYPPSHSGGWYFQRRSDINYNYNENSNSNGNFKRQLDIPNANPTSSSKSKSLDRPKKESYYYDKGNYFVIGGGGSSSGSNNYNNNYNDRQNSLYTNVLLNNNDNANLLRQTNVAGAGGGQGQDYFHNYNNYKSNNNYNDKYSNYDDRNTEKNYEEISDFPLNTGIGHGGNQYDRNNNVGIGSLTGRVLGGFGHGGITSGWTGIDQNFPCRIDYECPGNKKCCGGICSEPSFFG